MTAEILRDLARAKAVFQLRAICAAIGIDPTASSPTAQWSAGEGRLSPRALPGGASVVSHKSRLLANVGKHEGHQLADLDGTVHSHGQVNK